jgi:hypothetical protein
LRLRLSPEESTARRIYSRYKHRANKKGIPFDFPYEAFRLLLTWNCAYCGLKPDLLAKGKRGTLDQVSPSMGYVGENLIACCWKCNRAKSVMTQKEFLEWIRGCAESMHTSIWASDNPVSVLFSKVEEIQRKPIKNSSH